MRINIPDAMELLQASVHPLDIERHGKFSPGRTMFVDPQGYLAYNKVPGTKFPTMTEAFKHLQRGDVVMLYGKLRESGLITPPGLADITVIGMGTRERPGSTGFPNDIRGGGTDWVPSSNDDITGPTITVTSQGWSFKNIHFGYNKNAAAARLNRSPDNNTQNANHTQFVSCGFAGGVCGIEDIGGCANVGIFNSWFYEYNKSGSTAIICRPEGAVAWPLMWEISGNRFINNDRHVVGSLSNGIISGNYFFRNGFSIKASTMINLSGGKNNIVAQNQFQHRFDEVDGTALVYKAGDGDAWGPNYFSNGEKYGTPV